VRVGVFTALLAQLSLDDVLKKLKSINIDTVELGTGNYPGDPHCKLSMLDNKTERNEFKQKLADNGVSISALSCHGNPLHPDQKRAKHDQDVSRQTIRLAEKLGVPVVIDFSGCPGDCDKSKWPNWVTCPWPPEYLEILKWQWEAKVAPCCGRGRHRAFVCALGLRSGSGGRRQRRPGAEPGLDQTSENRRCLVVLRGLQWAAVACSHGLGHGLLSVRRDGGGTVAGVSRYP